MQRTKRVAASIAAIVVSRDDVDARHITLVGGSVGALFAPAVATDKRIGAVALLLGGADLDALGRKNLKLAEPVKSIVLWPLSILASPVEPAKYVGRISPRPVLMINASGDPAIPPACARRLHDLAGEPKTVRWIHSGHVTIRDKEFGRLVVRELVDWLTAQGLTPPGALELGNDRQALGGAPASEKTNRSPTAWQDR